MTDPPAKNFSIRLEFRNLQSIIYAKKYYGVTENHFGIEWRICLYHEKGQFFYGLECLKLQNQQNWKLGAFIESNLKNNFGTMENLKTCRCSKSENYWKFTKFNQLKKLVPDEILFVEFRVNLGSKKSETPQTLNESENCAISTDSLKCTVCYEIFPGAPMIVQCGHSFCISCVENLKKSSSANCPICRKYVNFSTAVPNFTLKNVLDSLEELGKKEKRPFENTKNITIERLQEQNSQLEREKETAKDDLRFAETFIIDYWSQIQHLKAQSAQRNSTARKYKFLFIGVCGFLVISIYQYYQLKSSITKQKCWFF